MIRKTHETPLPLENGMKEKFAQVSQIIPQNVHTLEKILNKIMKIVRMWTWNPHRPNIPNTQSQK